MYRVRILRGARRDVERLPDALGAVCTTRSVISPATLARRAAESYAIVTFDARGSVTIASSTRLMMASASLPLRERHIEAMLTADDEQGVTQRAA